MNERPSAVTNKRLLLLVTFLRRIAFIFNMVWMHSVLKRGGVLISVLAFGLSVSRNFIDLTPDGNQTTHNNTLNGECIIDDDRIPHSSNNNSNIDDSSLNAI